MTFTAKNGWDVDSHQHDGWVTITIGHAVLVNDDTTDDTQVRILQSQYDALAEYLAAVATAERNAWMGAGGGEVWHFVLDDGDEFDAVATTGLNTRHWTAANDVPLPYAFNKHIARSWKVMSLAAPRATEAVPAEAS